MTPHALLSGTDLDVDVLADALEALADGVRENEVLINRASADVRNQAVEDPIGIRLTLEYRITDGMAAPALAMHPLRVRGNGGGT